MQKHKLSNGILLDELHTARHRYVAPSCSVMALDAEWSLMAGSTEFGAGHNNAYDQNNSDAEEGEDIN